MSTATQARCLRHAHFRCALEAGHEGGCVEWKDRDIGYDALTRMPEEMSVYRLMEVIRYLREEIYQHRLTCQKETP
jgi:hypothetical protein